jgi:two-component system, NarL family, nitrate/nitrite response regulator NarL
MTNGARIVLVDDHPLFRGGVAYALSQEPDIQIVAEGTSAADAVTLARLHAPDLLLLDIDMPGDVFSTISLIRQTNEAIRIAILTASDDEDNVTAAFRSGAAGYILKGIMGRELATILRSLMAGNGYVPPSLAAVLISHLTVPAAVSKAPLDPLHTLTEREYQILERVAAGWSNKEIANALSLTEKTVKYYMTIILQKLQVRNRTEAALLLQRAVVTK